MMGRVTLNPLRHIDPLGTVVVPIFGILMGGFMFGWAKPVPVNYRALNHPRRDAVLVALAGPGTNILLAIISILLFHGVAYLPEAGQAWTANNLANSFQLNLVLAVFNLLPLPPLDGGRVAVGLLPQPFSRQLAELEPIGIWIILAVLILLPTVGDLIHRDLNLFRPLVLEPANWIGQNLLAVLGPGD